VRSPFTAVLQQPALPNPSLERDLHRPAQLKR
jgi:hypothetical protein